MAAFSSSPPTHDKLSLQDAQAVRADPPLIYNNSGPKGFDVRTLMLVVASETQAARTSLQQTNANVMSSLSGAIKRFSSAVSEWLAPTGLGHSQAALAV